MELSSNDNIPVEAIKHACTFTEKLSFSSGQPPARCHWNRLPLSIIVQEKRSHEFLKDQY